MQNLTNISNYLGEHKTGTDYQKFDFVFNKVDGLYYYAKNDIPWQDPSIISETNRFTLDPNGPIWGGRQTFYLFDAQNNLPNFIKHGSLIQIEGSIYNNDGSYKVLGNPIVSYSPNNAVAGDYVLSELLNGVEGSKPDYFVSDWFLLGENNFFWNGRDFEAYVNNHQDLLNYYTVNVQGLEKEEWGKIHYTEYGEAENRSLPIKNNGNWFYHPLLRWVYIPVLASQTDPLDKSFWFKLAENKDAPQNKFWFWTKQSWAGTNNDAYIAYEDEGVQQIDYSVEDENTTFTDNDVRELDASADGNTLLVRTDTGIKRYENESGTWNQKASLSFNGTFRYLACDGSCDTIAVFGYENRYHLLTKGDIEVGVSGGYPVDNLTSGLSWETYAHSGPINERYWHWSTSNLQDYYVAGDVFIYKYNQTSQSFELQHTIEKIIGVELTADFDATGENLCIYEPLNREGYSFLGGWSGNLGKINSALCKKIKVYSLNGSSWSRSLTCVFPYFIKGHIFSNNDSKSNRLLDKINSEDLANFIYQGRTGDLDAVGSQVIVFYEEDLTVSGNVGNYWDYIQEDISVAKFELYSEEGKSVTMSKNGKRIFWSSSFDGDPTGYQNGGIRYIEKLDSNFWQTNSELVKLPVHATWNGKKQTRGIVGSLYENIGTYRSYFNLKTNYDGSALIYYGRYVSGNDQQIYDALNDTYTNVSNIIEDTMIEIDGEWQYKELIIEGPTYDYRYRVNNLIVSSNSEGRTRVAVIVGKEDKEDYFDDKKYINLHPKKNYSLEYLSDSLVYTKDFYQHEQNLKKSAVVILELSEQNEWIKCNQFSYNSIDIAVDANIDNLFNLEYDESSSYKNKLKRFDISSDFEYTFEQKNGSLYIQRHDSSESKIVDGWFDAYDFNNYNRWFVFKDGQFYVDSKNRPAPTLYTINENDVEPRQEAQNLSTRIWMHGLSESDSIDDLEERGSQEITLSSSSSVPPGLYSDDWVADQFFFDADYGSSVDFKCDNILYEYSDGYYNLQPNGINSLKISANLQFKNRTSREANAIVHFVESHLGQHDKDRPSSNLKYSQGIEGFSWAGESTFHPYDTTDIQSKKFYCLKYDHSLKFENSNDVSVTLENLDTSILNKSEALYVGGAQTYSDDVFYEEHDIVFCPENHEYYYCVSQESIVGESPIQENESWSREGGDYSDANQNSWTRDFVWSASIGLKIAQTPRMKKVESQNSYVQIYRDGINNNLLSLDLEFNNRSDEEARAILHFLEHHYGCVPFNFEAPSPYDKKRMFVCQEWTHTYNFKNNHSIKAKFNEFPFQVTDQKFRARVTESIARESELSIPKNILFEDVREDLYIDQKVRKRIYLKNIGDKPLEIESMRIGNKYYTNGLFEQNEWNVSTSAAVNNPEGNAYLSGGELHFYGTSNNLYAYPVSGWSLQVGSNVIVRFTIYDYEQGTLGWSFSVGTQHGGGIAYNGTFEIQAKLTSNNKFYFLLSSNFIGKIKDIYVSEADSPRFESHKNNTTYWKGINETSQVSLLALESQNQLTGWVEHSVNHVMIYKQLDHNDAFMSIREGGAPNNYGIISKKIYLVEGVTYTVRVDYQVLTSGGQGRFFVGPAQGTDYYLGVQTCSSTSRDINGATFTSPVTGFAWLNLAAYNGDAKWIRFYGVTIETNYQNIDPSLDPGVEQNLAKSEFLNFKILGQTANQNASVMMLENDDANDYIIRLPSDDSLPFGLSNQFVKIYKKYSQGIAGGITFSIVDEAGDKYVRRVVDGKANTFFQNNTGSIINVLTGEISDTYKKYIDHMFIQNNAKNILGAGQTGYVDVYYENLFGKDDIEDTVADLNFLRTNYGNQAIQFDQRLNIEVKNSDYNAGQDISVFNGDFLQGMSGWEDHSSHGESVDSSNFSNNQLTLTRYSGSPNPVQMVIQRISGFNSGTYYKLKLNVASCVLNGVEDNEGLVFIVETPDSGQINLATRKFGAGLHEFVFRAQAKNLYLVLEGGHQGGVTTIFNSISIEKYPTTETYQSNMEIFVLNETIGVKKN